MQQTLQINKRDIKKTFLEVGLKAKDRNATSFL